MRRLGEAGRQHEQNEDGMAADLKHIGELTAAASGPANRPGIPRHRPGSRDIERERTGKAEADDRGRVPFEKPADAGTGEDEGNGAPQAYTAVIHAPVDPRAHGDGLNQRRDRRKDGVQHQRDEKDKTEPLDCEKKGGRGERGPGEPDHDAAPVANPVRKGGEEGADDDTQEQRKRHDERNLGGIQPLRLQPYRKERQIDAREQEHRAVKDRKADGERHDEGRSPDGAH